jgi:hypothetical protein
LQSLGPLIKPTRVDVLARLKAKETELDMEEHSATYKGDTYK